MLKSTPGLTPIVHAPTSSTGIDLFKNHYNSTVPLFSLPHVLKIIFVVIIAFMIYKKIPFNYISIFVNVVLLYDQYLKNIGRNTWNRIRSDLQASHKALSQHQVQSILKEIKEQSQFDIKTEEFVKRIFTNTEKSFIHTEKEIKQIKKVLDLLINQTFGVAKHAGAPFSMYRIGESFAMEPHF